MEQPNEQLPFASIFLITCPLLRRQSKPQLKETLPAHCSIYKDAQTCQKVICHLAEALREKNQLKLISPYFEGENHPQGDSILAELSAHQVHTRFLLTIMKTLQKGRESWSPDPRPHTGKNCM